MIADTGDAAQTIAQDVSSEFGPVLAYLLEIYHELRSAVRVLERGGPARRGRAGRLRRGAPGQAAASPDRAHLARAGQAGRRQVPRDRGASRLSGSLGRAPLDRRGDPARHRPGQRRHPHRGQPAQRLDPDPRCSRAPCPIPSGRGRSPSLPGWSPPSTSCGCSNPTVALLDGMAITIGQTRLSLYLLLKGGALAVILLWLASAASKLVQTRLRGAHRLTPSVQILIGQLARFTLLADRDRHRAQRRRRSTSRRSPCSPAPSASASASACRGSSRTSSAGSFC